jgi:hypothetical protein
MDHSRVHGNARHQSIQSIKRDNLVRKLDNSIRAFLWFNTGMRSSARDPHGELAGAFASTHDVAVGTGRLEDQCRVYLAGYRLVEGSRTR